MTAHPEFVAGFDGALRGGPLPAGLVARDPTEVERRFAVYRNNVAVSLTQALATRFPVTQRLVGEAFFAALARLYSDRHRPRSPILAEWGDNFAAFVAQFPPLAAYPYLGDVARIEYARGRAFHAADALPVDPAVLVAFDPDKVRLVLHASVMVLGLDHPGVSIWARHQPGGHEVPLATGAQTALILRDSGFHVPVRAIGQGDATLLQSLLSGDTLSVAAANAHSVEATYDPQPLLVSLMRAGAIVDARE